MKPATRVIDRFLKNTWTVLLLALLTAVGGVLPFVSGIQVGRGLLAWVIHIVASSLLFVAMVYSIRVRQENIAIRRIPATIHRINHDYRDALSVLFGSPAVVPTDEMRTKNEVQILESVCQRLAVLFQQLTKKPCTVTVKLTRKTDGHTYCSTLVRSERLCLRDAAGQIVQFSLNTGRNSALDTALRYTPGRKSYFFSSDLTKEKDGAYNNERQGWKQFYRSEIVCPIRYVKASADGRPPTSEDLGFLIVDTLSVNRLNDGFHLELLAACADQMYNFMSLLRGTYSVPPTLN
jgi:hypothetical protein